MALEKKLKCNHQDKNGYEETTEVKYGNTTFQVTSRYTGNVTLEHLIKRLILEEVKNSQLHL